MAQNSNFHSFSAGGGIFALTTTPVAIDLRALIGFEVSISCSADVVLSGAPDGSSTTLVSTATPASKTALIAEPLPANTKAQRTINSGAPYLVAATASGTGNLIVKVISRKSLGS